MKYILLLTFVASCTCLHVLDNPGKTTIREIQTEDGPVHLIVGKRKGKSLFTDEVPALPKSFQIFSKPMGVKNKKTDESRRAGRKLSTDDISEDVPIIEGVRMPDDESDKKTYRNARIIKNVLVPNDATIQSKTIKNFPNANDKLNQISSRQGRIMTGADDGPQVVESLARKQENEQENNARQTNNYNPSGQVPQYYHFYDPARVGMVSPYQNQQVVANLNNDQVVTYSFNTEGGASKSKDVVYGSGFASIPGPGPEKSNVKRTVQYHSDPSSFPSILPSNIDSGFSPSHVPYRNPRPVQNYVDSSSSNSQSSSFKFPEPSKKSSDKKSLSAKQQYYRPQAAVNSPFVHQPQFPNSLPSNVASSYQNIQYYPHHQVSQHQVPQHQVPQNQVPHHQVPQHQVPQHQVPQHQVPQHQVPQQYQQQVYNQNSYPTPQNVLGSSNQIFADSSVIPVDPSNFVIEDATFQTHPGAPIFNIPIPRPSQYSNRKQYDVQQANSYDPYNQQYYDYPVYEYVDNRPLIEKMMDPIRRVGDRFKKIASNAQNRLRIPERIDKIASGTVDSDAIPIFAGAAAVATLGALGAYAATRFNGLEGIRLGNFGKRDRRFSVPDILSQLADRLNDEEPSIVSKLTADTKWLESSCARKIFCTLVVDSFEEEVLKATAGRTTKPNFAQELLYLETQMNALIDSAGKDGAKGFELKLGAEEVLSAVRQRDCSVMTCSRNTR